MESEIDRIFWKRVKGLEGQEIYIPGRKKTRKVLEVTDDTVKIQGMKSPVRFNGKWGLFENYHVLQWDGYILPGDNVNSDNISIGIILAAVPEEVFLHGPKLKLKKPTYEQLGELLENLKTTMTNLTKVFPSGIPRSPEEIVSVPQKEAFNEFNRAWQALLAFRSRHPLLGSL